MTGRFILSEPASRDLDEIFEFVLENDGPQRAQHVVDRLYVACQKLSESPVLGHKREDLTPASVLFYAVWSYLIVYKPQTNPLQIARVLHSARDVKVILGEP